MEVQDHLETAEGRGQSVWRSMSLFLVPLLLSNVLQSVGQLVGMVFVGRWLGVDALAAVSSFFPLFFLLISFTIGIGSGSSIVYSFFSLGFYQGFDRESILKFSNDCLGPIASILLVIGAGGAFNNVLIDSGVGTYMPRVQRLSP